MLVGMAQIRHAQGGIWQEWYARFDSGRWGWLAEAQGRFYLTFKVDSPSLPTHLPAAGARVILLNKPFTVTDTKQASIIGAARRTIVLADSTKFNHQLLGHIASLEQIDILVTDAEPPAELFRALEEFEVRVLVAPPLNAKQRGKAAPEYI